MNIVYDNIIFSLQTSGGISVVWAELIKKFLSTHEPISFIEYNTALKNKMRNTVYIPDQLLIPLNSARMTFKRYFDPPVKISENTIFHSSYYRVIKHPKIANITSVHDFTYEYFRKGLAKYVHSLQKKRALLNADLIICVSESTKRDLLKFFPGLQENKITIIYNGVSDDFFKLPEYVDTDSLPYKPNTYLIYVGDRKAKYKNFETLIKCFPTNLSLLIAGSGTPTKKELKLLKKHLQPWQYKYIGYISNQSLNILYNHAKALIYPSSYEGFGIPIVEAQKAGCPVIALNTSSIPEVAGKGAILLNSLTKETLCDAVEKLNNRYFTQNLIITGLENAKNFTWDNAFAKTKDAYWAVWNKKFML